MTDDAREQPRPPSLRWATDEDGERQFFLINIKSGTVHEGVGTLQERVALYKGGNMWRPCVLAEALDIEALAEEMASDCSCCQGEKHQRIAAIRAVLEKHL